MTCCGSICSPVSKKSSWTIDAICGCFPSRDCVFSGSRNLEDILRIAINSISSGVYEGLREVHLVAYTQEEISTILHVLDGQSGPIPSSILIGSGSADAIRFFMNNLEKSVTS